MTTTFDQLAIRVKSQLLGFTVGQESVSELAQDMTASDTSFVVDAGTVTNLSRGLVEIDDELILVKSYDRTSGVVSVMGLTNGRGAQATRAASHAAHALVTASPAFPRARIKEAVNQAVQGLYPDLPTFATTEITAISVVYEYGLPAAAKDVWSVALQTIGPTKVWQQARNFKFNPFANTGDFPTGKSLQLFDAVTPGRAMRVLYTTEPGVMSAGSDDFTAVTGYPDRIAELVVWGACSKLVGSLDAARLQQQAVEATERAALVPATSALKTASFYQQMYYQRLQEERRRMFEEVPQSTFYAGD